MFYNSISKKIIIGFNNNGKIDGIVKYFKDKIDPKLFIVKNGRKIKEIDNEEKINDYLNDLNNFDSKRSFVIDKSFNKYFFMKRNELEKILIGKCDIRDIEEINERLGKSNKTNNIDNPSK